MPPSNLTFMCKSFAGIMNHDHSVPIEVPFFTFSGSQDTFWCFRIKYDDIGCLLG